jgi:D-arginine dehydrogenase
MVHDQRILIIGGGIAGLSCAANLSALGCRSVTVLEAEAQPGYHSSGRSAAVYIEPYMNETVFGLSRASLDFFAAPDPDFWERPIVEPRQSVVFAGEAVVGELDAYVDKWADRCPEIHEISPAEAVRRVPVLRAEQVVRAVLDPRAMTIDVHGLLDGFRRMFLAHGGVLSADARVIEINRRSDDWVLTTATGASFEADIVVNAAGAWGDQIGVLAGAGRLGLGPLRRTAMLIGSEGHDTADWPLLYPVESTFYLKPESGQLLLSPSDATPTPPCDAQPEEFDVAVAVDRIQRATTLEVPTIERAWAGLRSFLPDDVPALGFDPDVAGFFWLIGQGGFGMQTSATMGRLSAAVLLGEPLPGDLSPWGVDPARLSPARLAKRTDKERG